MERLKQKVAEADNLLWCFGIAGRRDDVFYKADGRWMMADVRRRGLTVYAASPLFARFESGMMVKYCILENYFW
jgi:hypothetical protein